MPCPDHLATAKKCLNCFVNDVFELIGKLCGGLKSSDVKFALGGLGKRYKELDEQSQKSEHCTSALANLNIQLVANKHEPALAQFDGEAIAPEAILDGHRAAYLARLRQMGTWVGFTEFSVLASLCQLRFRLLFRAGAVWRALEVGDPLHPIVPTRALRWDGNHYEVTGFNEAPVGTFACINVVQTNPYGDCGLESFLIMLQAALAAGPLRAQVWGLLPENIRRSVRDMAELVGAAHGAVVDANSQNYQTCIQRLRDELAASMRPAEINDAIVAEGELPDIGDKKKSKEVEKVELALPELALGGDPRALPWAPPFAITTKRINQAGYQACNVARLAGTSVYVVGANYNAGNAVWTGAIDFLNAVDASGGALDASSNLYSVMGDRANYDFIDDTGLAMHPRPTHIGACLVKITTAAGSWYFLSSGVNMHPGNGAGANATVAHRGKSSGNGLHSEKYVLGLTARVLRGFGVDVGAKVLEPLKDFGGITVGGAGVGHKVQRVDVFFLNIADMCITCRGYWANFRNALLAAKVKEVHGYLFYFAHDIDSWS